MNLNNIEVGNRDPSEYNGYKQYDYSIIGDDKDIEVYFKNIEKHIIKKIEKYTHVVGCVAWLTNVNILNALSKKEGVLIIVQEEDFLRPDTNFDGDKNKFKNSIMKFYRKLEKTNGVYLGYFGISYNCGSFSGIRRLGFLNTNKLCAFPRMHNKFIICYNDGFNRDDNNNFYVEGEILTGSYNYTENSNNSFENVICIKDKCIVMQYFKQFAEIATMSIPLNWNGDWSPHNSDINYGS